jgi:hypothetical protein
MLRLCHWHCCFALLSGAVLAISGCDRGDAGGGSQTAGGKPLPSEDELRKRIDAANDFSFTARHLNTKDHAAWQVVHGSLAYGPSFEISLDGELVPAIQYLLDGGALKGWNLRKGDRGVEAIVEEGSKTGQGHKDQWLGYLSQVGLKPDTKMTVGGESYTVQDLIEQAKWDLRDPVEATWTLMAFSTYFPLDAQWEARDGSTWTIDRIVEMEAGQPLAGAACGGSHRMYALAVARNRARIEGVDKGPAWSKAEAKIQDAVAKAREYQQADGAFSSHMFDRPASTSEISGLLHSTGHILEFLAVALNDEQLKEPWVTRAVAKLLGILEATQSVELECGGLYHAVHGLELYRIRRWGVREDVAWSKHAEPIAIQASRAGKAASIATAKKQPAKAR